MPKKSKILYVITQGAWGGAQRYVFDLSTSLYDDFEVILAIGESEGKKDLQSRITRHVLHTHADIKIIQLKHLIRKISPFYDLRAVFELRQLYKKIRPDIIHLNSSKAGILGSLARWLVKCELCFVVYTVHGWVFNEPLGKIKKWMYKSLEKYTTHFKNKIIVLSEYDKKQAAQKLNITQDKLEHISLGIGSEINKLNKEQARLRLENKNVDLSSVVIGTIAGLYKTKGIDVLIDATNRIRDKLKDVDIVIIGDGPEKHNILSKIKNLRLQDYIKLVGHIDNAAELMLAFDLFVLPSRKEGLPYTILESIRAGIPTIATKVGGVPEMIQNKKTGLLVSPDDADELATTILYAVSHKQECTQYAHASKSVLDQHSLEHMVKRTSTVYKNLLHQ